MTVSATWRTDGRHASLSDDDGFWVRLELVDDWYAPGSRTPERAWVVEWLDERGEPPSMVRTRLDVEAEPATDEEAMSHLSELAARIARGAVPETPAAFGHADTGLDAIHRRVALVSHAIQGATGRLDQAAARTEEWGGDLVLIALTETIAWVRALDDAMDHIWRARPQPGFDRVTARIDHALASPGWDPAFVTWAKSHRSERGYNDWTIGLVIRSTGLPRDDLAGLRWLAGKLLHFGPLPAAELKQWRDGEPPRWKWRAAADIFPRPPRAERRSEDRLAYDRRLAGRDVTGTFNLFHALLAAEFLALDLAGRDDDGATS